MAFTAAVTCDTGQLSLEQYIRKYLLVLDSNGDPALKVITTNDALLASLSDKRITALNNAAQAVKATSGNILGWNIINPNASVVYVKFYNKAFGAVVVGTDVPVMTLMIPSNGSVYQEANCIQLHNTIAISVAATLNLADADATAVVTSLQINVKYN